MHKGGKEGGEKDRQTRGRQHQKQRWSAELQITYRSTSLPPASDWSTVSCNQREPHALTPVWGGMQLHQTAFWKNKAQLK